MSRANGVESGRTGQFSSNENAYAVAEIRVGGQDVARARMAVQTAFDAIVRRFGGITKIAGNQGAWVDPRGAIIGDNVTILSVAFKSVHFEYALNDLRKIVRQIVTDSGEEAVYLEVRRDAHIEFVTNAHAETEPKVDEWAQNIARNAVPKTLEEAYALRARWSLLADEMAK